MSNAALTPATESNRASLNTAHGVARVLIPLAIFFYWVALVTATHWPKLELPPVGLLRWDKLAHFSGYCILCFLLLLAPGFLWRADGRPTKFDALCAWLIIALLGILDEVTQPLPLFKRDFEWLDYVADLSGAFVAILLSRLFFSYWRSRRRATA